MPLQHLDFARYRLTFQVTETLHLPDYAGSMLRGIFGRALVQLSGLQLEDVKNKTPLFLHSPYAQVFEPHDLPRPEVGLLVSMPQLPVPYVIEPPLQGQRNWQPDELLVFDLVLIGAALKHLPLLLLAWRRAFLQGVSKSNQGKAQLLQVEHCPPKNEAQVIYSEAKPVVQPHQTQISVPPFVDSQTLHLHFLTPLRLQREGRILGEQEVSAALLLRSLIRRVSVFQQMQQPESDMNQSTAALNALADAVRDERHLLMRKWQRYSLRQKQHMNMDGLTGHWLLRDVPPALLPYVWLGHYLHAGKGAAFGLGFYEVSNQPWQSI